MVKNGCHQSQGDQTLFIKHSTSMRITTLIVFVDDIIITEYDEKEMPNLNVYLAKGL